MRETLMRVVFLFKSWIVSVKLKCQRYCFTMQEFIINWTKSWPTIKQNSYIYSIIRLWYGLWNGLIREIWVLPLKDATYLRPSSFARFLKTEWQIRHSIIGDRPPNWSARKLLMCRSVIRMVNQPFLKTANEEGRYFSQKISISVHIPNF